MRLLVLQRAREERVVARPRLVLLVLVLERERDGARVGLVRAPAAQRYFAREPPRHRRVALRPHFQSALGVGHLGREARRRRRVVEFALRRGRPGLPLVVLEELRRQFFVALPRGVPFALVVRREPRRQLLVAPPRRVELARARRVRLVELPRDLRVPPARRRHL